MEPKTITPKYRKQGITKTDNYNKSYYEINKDKWKQYNTKQNSQYLDCELCQCSVQYSHRNKHYETKRHQKNMLLISEPKATDENKNYIDKLSA
jgi:recombinational DNA repair ATPase RecF